MLKIAHLMEMSFPFSVSIKSGNTCTEGGAIICKRKETCLLKKRENGGRASETILWTSFGCLKLALRPLHKSPGARARVFLVSPKEKTRSKW